MLRVQDLHAGYGASQVLNGVSLEVKPGTVVALIGANGAGKTTTIKMLVGLLRPSRGSVCVAGRDLVGDPRGAHLHLGYVPDEPCLYEKLTGREFLWFIADMFGMRRDLAERRIAAEIGNFELGDFADDLAESYSLGMRQRLVFASSLLHDPDVLVLDEPMVGLDPRSVRIVKDLLRERTRAGMTIFMSTHTLAMAEEMADRVGIMVRGRLVFLGTVAELRMQGGGVSPTVPGSGSLEQLYLDLTSAAGGDDPR